MEWKRKSSWKNIKYIMSEKPKIIKDSGKNGALGMITRIIGPTVLASEIEMMIRLKGRDHPDVTELLERQKKINEVTARFHKADNN